MGEHTMLWRRVGLCQGEELLPKVVRLLKLPAILRVYCQSSEHWEKLGYVAYLPTQFSGTVIRTFDL
jgi:hypothetical protein